MFFGRKSYECNCNLNRRITLQRQIIMKKCIKNGGYSDLVCFGWRAATLISNKIIEHTACTRSEWKHTQNWISTVNRSEKGTRHWLNIVQERYLANGKDTLRERKTTIWKISLFRPLKCTQFENNFGRSRRTFSQLSFIYAVLLDFNAVCFALTYTEKEFKKEHDYDFVLFLSSFFHFNPYFCALFSLFDSFFRFI